MWILVVCGACSETPERSFSALSPGASSEESETDVSSTRDAGVGETTTSASRQTNADETWDVTLHPGETTSAPSTSSGDQSPSSGDPSTSDVAEASSTHGDTETATAEVPLTKGCDVHADCDDGNLCNGEERCNDGVCIPGAALPNGEVCNGGGDDWYVCRDGNCWSSRCGDGIVDERASEVCDDGNDERNDGCDDCRFSCETAGDCNDSNVCNGDEVCDAQTHTCVAGLGLEDGTECGPAHVCRGERCVSAACGDGQVDLDEECDDGNLLEGDGCGLDCRYECKSHADCNDGNACNGEETCDLELHICIAGEALNCDDGNPCTNDVCDALRGCVPTLIDADGDGHAPSSLGKCGTDCDDEDPNIFAGAAELCDGVDNNCDGKVDEVAPFWYPDCDGDGFAAADAKGVQQCEKPTSVPDGCGARLSGGWTSRAPTESADCWDADPDVYPGQTQSRSTPIPGLPGKQLPFDYNCNKIEEPQWTATGVSGSAVCGRGIILDPVPGPVLFLVSSERSAAPENPELIIIDPPLRLCSGAAGWVGSTVPACGAYGEYTYCDGCTRIVEKRAQQCR
jgi:cysteine-rich repeat protein